MADVSVQEAFERWESRMIGAKAGRFQPEDVRAAYDDFWRAVVHDCQGLRATLTYALRQQGTVQTRLQSVYTRVESLIKAYAKLRSAKTRIENARVKEYARDLPGKIDEFTVALSEFRALTINAEAEKDATGAFDRTVRRTIIAIVASDNRLEGAQRDVVTLA